MSKTKRKNTAAFQQAIREVSVFDFLSFRDYLTRVFEKAKSQSNVTYTHLDFSEDLGFKRTKMSHHIVSGRRSLTSVSSEAVAKALGLKFQARSYFVALVEHHNARLSEDRERAFRRLIELKDEILATDDKRRMLRYFSEWYYPVIRELTALKDFKSDPTWVSNKLYQRLLPKQILESLELLDKLNLITFDQKLGRHVRVGSHITPDKEVEAMAAVRFHHKMIEIAKEAVTQVPAKRRDFNSVTVCISDDRRQAAVRILHKAIKEIMALEESDKNPCQVYQLNLQFFPFTK